MAADKQLLELLNKSIAREMGVSIQYMWQHVMAMGMESPAVSDIFRDIAITEMKHAEAVAERLWYLGGTPTTKPTEIKVGGTLKEMVEVDLKAEEEAIALYKTVINRAIEVKDPVTRLLFEKILSEEEEHHDKFGTLLSIK